MPLTFSKKNLSIPVMGIPYYNRPDLLARCLRSIDVPVQNLVIIHNGPAAERPRIRKRKLFGRITFIDNRGINTGVAASWNFIVKNYPASWWLLVNSDIQFTKGDLAKMTMAAQDKYADSAVFFGNYGFSMFILTAFGVANVGLFDENIWPAYLEDCDWSWRCTCSGLPQINVQEIGCIHGEDGSASCTIKADPELRQRNSVTHGNNFTYYRRKWGGSNGEEQFRCPFNNPALPLSYWNFSPVFRRLQAGAGGEKSNFQPEDEKLVQRFLKVMRQEGKASTSLLQRRLGLGYNKAAGIMKILEQRGYVGPGDGAKPRAILRNPGD